MKRATLAACLALAGCTDLTVPQPATYADLNDEIQARVNDLNRTLVRCWDVPTCRGSVLITWTPWDSTIAPAFIVRRKP